MANLPTRLYPLENGDAPGGTEEAVAIRPLRPVATRAVPTSLLPNRSFGSQQIYDGINDGMCLSKEPE